MKQHLADIKLDIRSKENEVTEQNSRSLATVLSAEQVEEKSIVLEKEQRHSVHHANERLEKLNQEENRARNDLKILQAREDASRTLQ